MVDIEQYRRLNHDENIAVTNHARMRFAEREIALDDIEKAIETGQIIEEYPGDKPFPSCLISAHIAEDKVLHLVVSSDDEFLYIITAYWPDPEKWTDDFTKRKGNDI